MRCWLSTEEASVRIRFGLTSFADKIYQWREASERYDRSASGFLRNNRERF
jgi:hypothetical protein